jgi:hypothetical protein
VIEHRQHGTFKHAFEFLTQIVLTRMASVTQRSGSGSPPRPSRGGSGQGDLAVATLSLPAATANASSSSSQMSLASRSILQGGKSSSGLLMVPEDAAVAATCSTPTMTFPSTGAPPPQLPNTTAADALDATAEPHVTLELGQVGAVSSQPTEQGAAMHEGTHLADLAEDTSPRPAQHSTPTPKQQSLTHPHAGDTPFLSVTPPPGPGGRLAASNARLPAADEKGAERGVVAAEQQQQQQRQQWSGLRRVRLRQRCLHMLRVTCGGAAGGGGSPVAGRSHKETTPGVVPNEWEDISGGPQRR